MDGSRSPWGWNGWDAVTRCTHKGGFLDTLARVEVGQEGPQVALFEGGKEVAEDILRHALAVASIRKGGRRSNQGEQDGEGPIV